MVATKSVTGNFKINYNVVHIYISRKDCSGNQICLYDERGP